MVKTGSEVHVINLSYRTVCAPLHLFTTHKIIRVWPEAFTGPCQFLGTGDAHGNNLPGIDLIPGCKGLEPPFVTPAYQHTHGIIGITAGEVDQLLIERIPAVPRPLSVTQHHGFKIAFLAEKMRSHVPVHISKAQKAFDFTGIQKLLDPFFYFIDHLAP